MLMNAINTFHMLHFIILVKQVMSVTRTTSLWTLHGYTKLTKKKKKLTLPFWFMT